MSHCYRLLTLFKSCKSVKGLMVCCPEEIAYNMGYITADSLRRLAELKEGQCLWAIPPCCESASKGGDTVKFIGTQLTWSHHRAIPMCTEMRAAVFWKRTIPRTYAEGGIISHICAG